MGSIEVYSVGPGGVIVDAEWAEKLDIVEDLPRGHMGDEFGRHCGCSEYDECGHLEGMTIRELRQIEAFADLLPEEANRLLQWLRDSASQGQWYSGRDYWQLREVAIGLSVSAYHAVIAADGEDFFS